MKLNEFTGLTNGMGDKWKRQFVERRSETIFGNWKTRIV